LLRLVAEADGRIVGAVLGAWSVRDGILTLTSEGAVHPAARRQGIGRTLLRQIQERLAAATACEEPALDRRFDAWIDDGQAGAIALLEGDGYTVTRCTIEMVRRDLDDIAPQPLPEGLEIRGATPAEVPAILAAANEAFRDNPGHREQTDEDTANLLGNPNHDPSLWRVAWDGAEVAGVVQTWILTTDNERLGVKRAWLGSVSVRRPWRQRGIARALIAETFAALRERGITEAMLGVDAQNPSGALQLYESLGFVRQRGGRLYGRPAPRPTEATP
jgi:mycothiol synthase